MEGIGQKVPGGRGATGGKIGKVDDKSMHI